MEKTDFKLLKFRASVFVPTITYNNTNLLKVLGIHELASYTPNVAKVPSQIQLGNPFIQFPLSNFWELISPNQKEHVCFVDNKIDINIDIDSEDYSIERLKDLSSYSSKLFCKMLSEFGIIATRLAIAPTLAKVIDSSESCSFAKSFFPKQFENSQAVSCTFSNVYRVNKNIGEASFLINYVSNFNNGQFLDVKQVPNVVKNTLVIALDVNTFADLKYKFPEESLIDFYEKSPMWVENYVDFYLNDKNNEQ